MALYDLPLEQLEAYRPEIAEPDDFDAFWSTTLAQSRSAARAPVAVPVDTGLARVKVHDVSFSGYGGEPIKAWLSAPAEAAGPLPVVVQFQGYGGGRGLPVEHTLWPSVGVAHLMVDTRGQGAAGWGSVGDTPDPHGSGPAHSGFLTRGILDPHEHYYVRAMTDAALAIDAAAALPGVEASRIIVAGASQGGALAIAAVGLHDAPIALMADVAFLCHIRRAVDLVDGDPYDEVRSYLAAHRDRVEQVFHTLSYVDAANHARRGRARALWSVALRDTTCPPSTTYAAFHRYGELGGEPDKRIEVYPYNNHEGGGAFQIKKQLEFVTELLAGAV
ncbi:acetylxylan esterase [Demequina capsici]|uniref:Acetylxylan esterase n=1 Tax=Demequina capsici TaxID=3075620 RepID=A0AA96F7S0_9MICO|nr:acetylxylan esterase [Demequina sp. OYTSA14]WNM24743.1 acetylxylan esterase [Demequina sp. OYTSA14]